jgi:RHS repeat-associated protein
VTKVRTYLQCGIEIDDDQAAGEVLWHHYISTPDGTIADLVTDGTVGGTVTPYYFLYDHLGSVYAVCNGSGSIATFNNEAQIYNFDPWGRRRNYSDWSYQNVPAAFITDRGFTSHEHLLQFDLINMNGRVYDPRSALFLSPDPYIQNPSSTLSHNRYSYCFNNPLVYVDPDGHNPLIIAAAVIGGIAGGYTGYRIADAKGYDMGDWQTYGYMLGGAAIGAFSGYAGASITVGGGFMANTGGIMASSYINSLGMAGLSGGMIQPSVSFGFGSLNLSTGEFRSIFNWGDLSVAERIGYTFGALANVQDLFAWTGGGEIEVGSHNSFNGRTPHFYIKGDNIDISVANEVSTGAPNMFKYAIIILTNPIYRKPAYYGGFNTSTDWIVKLYNVRAGLLQQKTSNILWNCGLYGKSNLRFGLGFGCVQHTSRALLASGVWFIPFNPIPQILNLQLLIRQAGIFASPYLVSPGEN